MKKSVLIGVLVLSLAALLAVGSWAWFTSEAGPVTNTFTAGTVEIKINDECEVVDNWNPGDTADKKVSVTNNGTLDAYVRVKLTPAWGAIGENDEFAESSLSTTNVTLNWNETDWMYSDSDDYYYYKGTLAGGGTTPLLLRSVTLVGSDTNNNYQGKVLKIEVEAEAVQASHEAYKEVWELDSLPEDGVQE